MRTFNVLPETHPIFTSIQKHDIETVRHYIDHQKKKINLKSWCNQHYFARPICDAIILGFNDIVGAFLEEGACASATIKINRLEESYSLCNIAIEVNNFEALTLLVSGGAEPDNKMLIAAIDLNRTEMVLYLLRHGAPADCNHLALAARRGNETLVAALVEKKISAGTALKYVFYHYLRVKNSLVTFDQAFSLMTSKLTATRSISYEQHLLRSMTIASNNRKKFADARDLAQMELQRGYRILLDYCQGKNFDTSLNYFEVFDAARSNFRGISINGIPVNRDTLKSITYTGADEAFITEQDHDNIKNEQRRNSLKKRTAECAREIGGVEHDGIINLVPISAAAKINDEATVAVRLARKGVTNSYYIVTREAAEAGHLEIVKQLVEHPTFENYTLIHLYNDAKRKGQQSICEYLKTRLELYKCEGDTLLHTAVRNGNIFAVRESLSGDIDKSNVHKQTPLTMAAAMTAINGVDQPHQLQILELLLDQLVQNDDNYLQALHHAAKAGSLTALKFIFKKVREVKPTLLIGKPIREWYTEIIFGALHSYNATEILIFLQTYGFQFNVVSYQTGDTLITAALKMPHTSMDFIEFLLGKGVNPVALDNDRASALHLLATRTDFESKPDQFIKLLNQFIDATLQAENNGNALANLNKPDSKNLLSGVHHAAIHNNLIALECLFLKARCQQQWSHSRSALHEAVKLGHKDSVALLLKLGADVNARDVNGFTAYHQIIKQLATTEEPAKLNLYQEIELILRGYVLQNIFKKIQDHVAPLSLLSDYKNIFKEIAVVLRLDIIEVNDMIESEVLLGSNRQEIATILLDINHLVSLCNPKREQDITKILFDAEVLIPSLIGNPLEPIVGCSLIATMIADQVYSYACETIEANKRKQKPQGIDSYITTIKNSGGSPLHQRSAEGSVTQFDLSVDVMVNTI